MRNYLGASSAVVNNQGGSRMPAIYPGVPAFDPTAANSTPQPIYADAIQLNDNLIPALNMFDDLLNPLPDASDIVWWNYYDSFAIPSATAKSGSLFLNPNNSSPWLSNLTNSGRLQGDERMLVMGIRYEIWNDSSSLPMNIVTAKEIFRQFYSEFWLNNKPYTSHNGFQFLESLAPILVNTNYYALRPFIGVTLPLRIPIGRNVTFQAKYQLGVTPSLTGNWYMFSYIIGPLYRGVQ